MSDLKHGGISGPKERRNSLERYQAKAFGVDLLADAVGEINITHEDVPKNRKRVVNNHLYGHKSHNNDKKSPSKTHNVYSSGVEMSSDSKNIWFKDNKCETIETQKQQQGQRNDYHHKNEFSYKKNTETFKPSHKPSDMRILVCPPAAIRYPREITIRDLLIVNDLFCKSDDLTIYEKLLSETEKCGVESVNLWQLWHGDSHVIADDKKKWKEACPTFRMVLDKIKDFFQMDIKATRLNWYRDSKEWKPFHHDAAAVKPDKAKTQNLTVAVSFGAERDAAFEHAQTKTVISMPQPNGTIYAFSKEVNIIWRHGILQVPPDKYHNRGRISIIAWGWIDNMVDV